VPRVLFFLLILFRLALSQYTPAAEPKTLAKPAATIEVMGLDSTAIATAIAAAKSGDAITLQEDTFELTEPIRPKSAIILIGAGQEKKHLVFKGDKSSVFIGLNGCEDVEIADMALDGQNNPLVNQGIGGSNSRRLWLHHLTICNPKAKTWGPHAILFSGDNPTMKRGVTDSRIEKIGQDAQYGGGIRLAWGCTRK